MRWFLHFQTEFMPHQRDGAGKFFPVFRYSVYLVISTVLRSDTPLCFILCIRTFSFINLIVPILLSLDSLLTIFLTSSSCTSGNILEYLRESEHRLHSHSFTACSQISPQNRFLSFLWGQPLVTPGFFSSSRASHHLTSPHSFLFYNKISKSSAGGLHHLCIFCVNWDNFSPNILKSFFLSYLCLSILSPILIFHFEI